MLSIYTYIYLYSIIFFFYTYSFNNIIIILYMLFVIARYGVFHCIVCLECEKQNVFWMVTNTRFWMMECLYYEQLGRGLNFSGVLLCSRFFVERADGTHTGHVLTCFCCIINLENEARCFVEIYICLIIKFSLQYHIDSVFFLQEYNILFMNNTTTLNHKNKN